MELQSVVGRLNALSRRLLARILLAGAPHVLAVGVALGFITFALDKWLRLPTPVGAALLVGSLGCLAVLLYRRVLRRLTQKPSIDQLALMAERADPKLNDQLISAIQLERSLSRGETTESPELIRALVADTAQRFGQSSFLGAVSLKPTVKPLLLGLGMAALGIAAAVGFPAPAKLWFERQILLRDTPWPKLNQLLVTVVDQEKYGPIQDGRRTVLHVPERTPVQFTVAAAPGSVLPDEVTLISAPVEDEDNRQEIALARGAGREFFQHMFPPLLRSVTFHVVGGDDQDEDPLFEIRVARAPRVTRFYADYDYPDYTGLEDKSLPESNLSAPEGTRITMHFEVNMDLDEFALDFEQLGSVAPAKQSDGTYLHSMTVTSNDFWSYRLRGKNGVPSIDSPRFVLTVEADQAPRIVVELPSGTNLLFGPEALVPIKGVVSDDYGVVSLGMRYGKGGVDLSYGEITLAADDFSPPLPTRQSYFFSAVPIAQFKIPEQAATESSPAVAAHAAGEGDKFSFKLLASDNRKSTAAPEPHRVFGDYEFTAQVLSTRDLERELALRQTRLRDRIREIAALLDTRMTETSELRAAVVAESDQEQFRARFWSLEQDQNRISIELQAAARLFLKVYDGYLWNRIDKGFLNEKMISSLIKLYRATPAEDAFRVYGSALEDVRGQVDEAEVMWRLTAILDLMIRAAAERSPEAYRRIARAGLSTGRDDRIVQLDLAIEMQQLLREDVAKLLDRLEAWEDYLEIIQSLRDVQEIQSGVVKKIEKITKK